jgi:UDP-N-acetylmuramoylalanine--D-glutamate ligase
MRKELYERYFKDKKITVLGLGLLGRGLGDTQFLLKEGAEVICTDTRSKEKLAESINAISQGDPSNLTLVIGENRLSDFEQRDYVLTCAGMPVDYEYLEHARKHGVPIYMSAALLSSITMSADLGVTIIGITGTRGKTTTTQFIAHILRSSGLNVHLGGNVRGASNLPLLEELNEGDFLIIELDSWQLQGFREMNISPNIAVFTSFMDDHMNYYKNDKEAYFSDKAAIYRNQNEFDVLIASPQAASEIAKREQMSLIIPEERVFEMKLIGEHNQVAARLAYEVASQCGLSDEEMCEAIKTFEGVEGRLQDCGMFGGEKHVRVFNDNNATTEDATIAAINAINETYHKKPIVILGGADKGLSLTNLEHALSELVKVTVLLAGTGTDRLTVDKTYQFETLEECVDQAFILTEQDDIILFSPAFASFSKYFNNEYERNDVFMKTLQGR